MKAIYKAIALGMLLAGGAAGYTVGTWSLNDVRNQLKAIETRGAQADAARQATQKEIDQQLAARTAEYEKQVAALKSQFQQEKQTLAASLANSQQRLADLQSKTQSTDAELARLHAAKGSAAEADKAALQAKIDALEADKQRLTEEASGISCLAIKVPTDEVKLLAHSQEPSVRAER